MNQELSDRIGRMLNAGTSDGVRKAWQTRKSGGAFSDSQYKDTHRFNEYGDGVHSDTEGRHVTAFEDDQLHPDELAIKRQAQRESGEIDNSGTSSGAKRGWEKRRGGDPDKNSFEGFEHSPEKDAYAMGSDYQKDRAAFKGGSREFPFGRSQVTGIGTGRINPSWSKAWNRGIVNSDLQTRLDRMLNAKCGRSGIPDNKTCRVGQSEPANHSSVKSALYRYITGGELDEAVRAVQAGEEGPLAAAQRLYRGTNAPREYFDRLVRHLESSASQSRVANMKCGESGISDGKTCHKGVGSTVSTEKAASFDHSDLKYNKAIAQKVTSRIRMAMQEGGVGRGSPYSGGENTGWTDAWGSTGFSVGEPFSKEDKAAGRLRFHVVVSGKKAGLQYWNHKELQGEETYDVHEPVHPENLHPKIKSVFEKEGYKVKQVANAGYQRMWDDDVEYDITVDKPTKQAVKQSSKPPGMKAFSYKRLADETDAAIATMKERLESGLMDYMKEADLPSGDGLVGPDHTKFTTAVSSNIGKAGYDAEYAPAQKGWFIKKHKTSNSANYNSLVSEARMVNSGTSEGVRKAWETRRYAMRSRREDASERTESYHDTIDEAEKAGEAHEKRTGEEVEVWGSPRDIVSRRKGDKWERSSPINQAQESAVAALRKKHGDSNEYAIDSDADPRGEGRVLVTVKDKATGESHLYAVEKDGRTISEKDNPFITRSLSPVNEEASNWIEAGRKHGWGGYKNPKVGNAAPRPRMPGWLDRRPQPSPKSPTEANVVPKLANSGTPEGAKKGWETRKGGQPQVEAPAGAYGSHEEYQKAVADRMKAISHNQGVNFSGGKKTKVPVPPKPTPPLTRMAYDKDGGYIGALGPDDLVPEDAHDVKWEPKIRNSDKTSNRKPAEEYAAIAAQAKADRARFGGGAVAGIGSDDPSRGPAVPASGPDQLPNGRLGALSPSPMIGGPTHAMQRSRREEAEQELRNSLRKVATKYNGWLPNFKQHCTKKEVDAARALLPAAKAGLLKNGTRKTVRLTNGISKGKEVAFVFNERRDFNKNKNGIMTAEWVPARPYVEDERFAG